MAFAFIFESVGGTEWLLLLGVVLIVVGPKNLPSAARKMGEIMATLRRSADEFKRQLLSMDQEVRRTVEDAVKTDSSEPPSSGMQSGATDENPYPGYEGYEYYDDTQYDRAESEDAPSGEDGGGESVAEASQDGAPQAEETPAAAADAEEKLKEIKIVVLPPSEGGKA